MGVLHVDAHADLRVAYEGFTRSHASIMHNVLADLPEVAKLVQVGLRDLSEEEHERTRTDRRVAAFFDADLAREKLEGMSFARLVDPIVEALPRQVYVSFDVDGLDPALCPSTGTPVPGGLSFHEASYLLRRVVESGRTIVGFDLDEVAPGAEGDEWPANVGARLLYKLVGWTLKSRTPRP
jgi:agmatinase